MHSRPEPSSLGESREAPSSVDICSKGKTSDSRPPSRGRSSLPTGHQFFRPDERERRATIPSSSPPHVCPMRFRTRHLLAALALGNLVTGQEPVNQPPGTYPVRGRCVDTATGKPLSHCTVRLTGHMATGAPISWGIPEFVDPPPLVTGDDGRFEFRISPPLAWDARAGHPPLFYVDIEHPACASWFARCPFPGLVAMNGAEFGDIPMSRGVRPVLRVVDERQTPKPGVVIDAKLEAPEQSTTKPLERWEQRWQAVRTDISGSLPWSGTLQRGRWALKIRDRKVISAPEFIDIPDAGGSPPRILVVVATLSPADLIEGTIVDANGLAVGGGIIESVVGENGAASPTRIAEDGSFRIVRTELDGDRMEAQLRLQRNDRFDGYVELGSFAWGARGLAVEAPARRQLELEVSDATGAPVTTFSVHALPMTKHVGVDPVRLAGRFAGGRLELPLRDAEWSVLVVPADDRLAPSEWIPIAVGDLTKPLRVQLAARVVGTVSIRGADGSAVPGARVRLFTHRRQPFAARMTTLGGWLCDRGAGVKADALLAEGRTDEHGNVTLRGMVEPGSVILEIEKDGFEPTTTRVDAWGTHVPEVRVERK